MRISDCRLRIESTRYIRDELNISGGRRPYAQEVFVTERRHGNCGLPIGNFNPQSAIRNSDGLLEQSNAVFTVYLCHANLHNLILSRLDMLAHIVCLDRKLPVSPVDQHGKLHPPRAAKIDQAVERCAHSAAGIEDVIHQDQAQVIDVEFDGGFAQQGVISDCREIVTVQRYVEDSIENGTLEDRLNLFAEAPSEMHTTAPDADNGEFSIWAEFLHDLGCDSGQRQVHLLGVHLKLAFDLFRHAGFQMCRNPQ